MNQSYSFNTVTCTSVLYLHCTYFWLIKCPSHLFFCYMQVVWIKQTPCGSVDLSDLECKLKVRAWLFRVYLLNTTYLHGHWWSVGSSTDLCQFFLCWANCVIVFHFILAVLLKLLAFSGCSRFVLATHFFLPWVFQNSACLVLKPLGFLRVCAIHCHSMFRVYMYFCNYYCLYVLLKIKLFFISNVFGILRLLKLKTEGQTS